MADTPFPESRDFFRQYRNIPQGEIAHTCGVSQPAVHNWFHGKSRPEPSHIVLIIQRYGGDPRAFAVATGRDPVQVVSMCRKEPMAPEDFELARQQLAHIQEIRFSGYPVPAGRMAKSLWDWLKIKERKTDSLGHMAEIRRLQGSAIHEFRIATHEVSPANKAMIPFSKRASEQLEATAVGSSNQEFIALADFCMGDTYYMLHKMRLAVGPLDAARLLCADLKATQRELEVLRVEILTYTYLDEKREVLRLHKRIQQLVRSGNWTNPEIVVQTLEGAGRALGLVGLVDLAFDVFQMADSFNVTAPFRIIQLTRSKLEVVNKANPRGLVELEPIGQRALLLARDRWSRHAEQITRLLQSASR